MSWSWVRGASTALLSVLGAANIGCDILIGLNDYESSGGTGGAGGSGPNCSVPAEPSKCTPASCVETLATSTGIISEIFIFQDPRTPNAAFLVHYDEDAEELSGRRLIYGEDGVTQDGSEELALPNAAKAAVNGAGVVDDDVVVYTSRSDPATVTSATFAIGGGTPRLDEIVLPDQCVEGVLSSLAVSVVNDVASLAVSCGGPNNAGDPAQTIFISNATSFASSVDDEQEPLDQVVTDYTKVGSSSLLYVRSSDAPPEAFSASAGPLTISDDDETRSLGIAPSVGTTPGAVTALSTKGGELLLSFVEAASFANHSMDDFRVAGDSDVLTSVGTRFRFGTVTGTQGFATASDNERISLYWFAIPSTQSLSFEQTISDVAPGYLSSASARLNGNRVAIVWSELEAGGQSTRVQTQLFECTPP